MKRILQLLIFTLLVLNIVFQNQIYFFISYVTALILVFNIDLTISSKRLLYQYRRKKVFHLIMILCLYLLLALFFNRYMWLMISVASILYFIAVLEWCHIRIGHYGIEYKLKFYPWSFIEKKTIMKNYKGEYEIQLSPYKKIYVDKNGLDFIKM